MSDIFGYKDHRRYLSDYYEHKKSLNPSYSYQILAKKCGFNDKSSVYSIIKGRRKVSENRIDAIAKGLELNPLEAEYLRHLICFTQAKTDSEKKLFSHRLYELRSIYNGKKLGTSNRFYRDLYKFRSTWYHCVILSIIDMHEFKGDFRWLASMVTPSITSKQAKESVELLCNLKLIAKTTDGLYRITSDNPGVCKEEFFKAMDVVHQDFMKLASNAIDTVAPDKRIFSGLTIGISSGTYEKKLDELMMFEKKIQKIAQDQQKSERVYHFNFHLFPASMHEGMDGVE